LQASIDGQRFTLELILANRGLTLIKCEYLIDEIFDIRKTLLRISQRELFGDGCKISENLQRFFIFHVFLFFCGS
jgi:hypothetical protein